MLLLASLWAVTGAMVGSAIDGVFGFEARLGRVEVAGLAAEASPLPRVEGGCSPRLSPETLGALEGGSVAVDTCAVDDEAGTTVSNLWRDDAESFEAWLPAVDVRFEAVSMLTSSSFCVGLVGLTAPTASRKRV